VVDLDGGILASGLLDLQVNGAAGRMVDGSTDVIFCARCVVHVRDLGRPTDFALLITDTPCHSSGDCRRVQAARDGVPGFLACIWKV
jgi:N-acetylglucosamine-6-phosphate deacetylase